MSNLEKATLILRTCEATVNNALYTSFTWSNIDLRTLLGDMYYKYDRFNLNLVNITSTTQIYAFTASNTPNNAMYLYSFPDQAICLVNITGLPWVNQGYNPALLHNTNVAVAGTFVVPTTQFTNTSTNYGKTYLIFEKNQDVSNITIYSTIVETNTAPLSPPGFPFPGFAFLFNIFGIPKDPENQNGSRLII